MTTEAPAAGLVTADRVLLADGRVTAATIEITGERISAITERAGGTPGADPVMAGTIVPGFVDTHVHGGGGGDLSSTDVDSIRTALDFHRRHGTTTVLAGVVTGTLDAIVAQVEVLARLSRAGEIAGIHLETPFLSTKKCGAHPPALLRHPDPATIDRLLTAADDQLAMITIAPELPGGLDAVRRFTDAGVCVAVGHTAADADITRAAVDAGARVATHLFNAMPSIHHRDPGPVPVLLTDPRVGVEIVADGIHLAPEVVAMAIETAGVERTMLITDAMSAAGLSDGRYRLGTLEVDVSGGRAALIDADGEIGSIAGSTLTLDRAVGFVVRHARVSWQDAVRMASSTPARVHALDDVGGIAVGRSADLVVLDDDLTVRAVMNRGAWLPDEEKGRR